MKLGISNQNNSSGQLINVPPATLALLLVNICLYILLTIIPKIHYDQVIINFGFIPAVFTYLDGRLFQYFLTPLTHIFLHADFSHILINMLMLVTFGSIIEKHFGKKYLLLLFFVTAFSGILIHYIIYSESTAPVIGSSGAISGLFGSTLFMINKAKDKKYISGLWLIALLWVGVSVISGFVNIIPAHDPNSIAWAAHVGGFIAGIIITKLMKK